MEIIANALQTVQANQNVYFSDTVVSGGTAISHRDDSGLNYPAWQYRSMQSKI